MRMSKMASALLKKKPQTNKLPRSAMPAGQSGVTAGDGWEVWLAAEGGGELDTVSTLGLASGVAARMGAEVFDAAA